MWKPLAIIENDEGLKKICEEKSSRKDELAEKAAAALAEFEMYRIDFWGSVCDYLKVSRDTPLKRENGVILQRVEE